MSRKTLLIVAGVALLVLIGSLYLLFKKRADQDPDPDPADQDPADQDPGTNNQDPQPGNQDPGVKS